MFFDILMRNPKAVDVSCTYVLPITGKVSSSSDVLNSQAWYVNGGLYKDSFFNGSQPMSYWPSSSAKKPYQSLHSSR